MRKNKKNYTWERKSYKLIKNKSIMVLNNEEEKEITDYPFIPKKFKFHMHDYQPCREI